ncbi:MAG: hypothetical protein QOG04_994 [Actinomycetota bacterium]|jgi:Tol biopolymer transport system component|nr:hypothetical protein [Actinomycetota bacterium]
MKRLAISLALVVVAAIVLLLTRDSDEPRVMPTPSSSAEASGPTELIYADGSQLYIYDLATGDVSKGASMPTLDFDVSIDGTQWAATDGKPKLRDPDPKIKPTQIVFGEVESGSSEELGIGYSPRWSPDGTKVAAVAPADGYLICPMDVDAGLATEDPKGQGCTEGERVVIYAPADDESGVAIGGGAWKLLGWTGADRLVAASDESGAVNVGYEGATSERLEVVPVKAKDIIAMSPSDASFLVDTESGPAIIDSTVQDVVEVKAGSITEATWSPDGTTIFAMADVLSLIDVTSGEARVLDAKSSGSDLVWSADSSTIAYLQGNEAVVCLVQTLVCDGFPLTGSPGLLALR